MNAFKNNDNRGLFIVEEWINQGIDIICDDAQFLNCQSFEIFKKVSRYFIEFIETADGKLDFQAVHMKGFVLIVVLWEYEYIGIHVRCSSKPHYSQDIYRPVAYKHINLAVFIILMGVFTII